MNALASEVDWEVFWCYDGWHKPADRLEELLAEHAPWARLRRMDPCRPLEEQVIGSHVLIPTTGIVNAAAIAAAKPLRLIAQPAAGYSNIDLAAAEARGVPVTIAPGQNSQSVAEVAVMMMLMLLRRAAEAQLAFRERRVGEPVGHEAGGKVLGIIGLGRVGSRLAAAAEGLGMRVLGVNSSSSRQELEELLERSDVVSVHCPLTEQTHGLLGPKELALLKPGALLLNCARGEVVQRPALVGALASGRLGGVGLDVHWREELGAPDPSDPLYADPRVVALPHLGSATVEVYERFAGILLENILRARDGRELLHRLL